MTKNPSILADRISQTIGTHTSWTPRQAIQGRLSIIVDSPVKHQRRTICTILNSDRMQSQDLKLILSTPVLARALAAFIQIYDADILPEFKATAYLECIENARKALQDAGLTD